MAIGALGLLGGLGGGLLGSVLGKQIGGGSGNKWATALGGLGGALAGGSMGGLFDGGGDTMSGAVADTSYSQNPAAAQDGQYSFSSDVGTYAPQNPLQNPAGLNTPTFDQRASGLLADTPQLTALNQTPAQQAGLFAGNDFSNLKDIGAGLSGAGNIYSTIKGVDQSQELIDMQKNMANQGLLDSARQKKREEQAEANMGAGFGNYYYT